MAREDAVRQACGIRLLRKYMQILQGDMRASVISSMRSNFMVSTNSFHHDKQKDAIFAEALSKARTELPFLWEAQVGSGEWKTHEPAVCAQLEDALARSKDQLAVTSQRKSFLMCVHGRTQIDVATGRNDGLRRRKPEIVYKTVLAQDDSSTMPTKLDGSPSSRGGSPQSQSRGRSSSKESLRSPSRNTSPRNTSTRSPSRASSPKSPKRR